MKNAQFPRVHVGYGVKNIKETIDFYTKFFQTEPAKVKEDYAKFVLAQPSLNISFNQTSKPVEPGHIHFGIEVNDPDQLKQRLGNAMNHELSIDLEKDVKCCYAKQDKFWVTDPDGYRWEVFIFNVKSHDADHWNYDVDHSVDTSFQVHCLFMTFHSRLLLTKV